jgi:hypothetical protein
MCDLNDSADGRHGQLSYLATTDELPQDGLDGLDHALAHRHADDLWVRPGEPIPQVRIACEPLVRLLTEPDTHGGPDRGRAAVHLGRVVPLDEPQADSPVARRSQVPGDHLDLGAEQKRRTHSNTEPADALAAREPRRGSAGEILGRIKTAADGQEVLADNVGGHPDARVPHLDPVVPLRRGRHRGAQECRKWTGPVTQSDENPLEAFLLWSALGALDRATGPHRIETVLQ